MYKFFKHKRENESVLYNKILSLSRNKMLFTKFNLADTFQNRIGLIFLHTSFLFVKLKQDNNKEFYKDFSQKMFDHTFKEIESNMRESSFGDITVNKNMKFFVKIFYNILLGCENYRKKSKINKSSFLFDYLTKNNNKNHDINEELVNYFDKYEAFCFDLSSDSVLSGDLNFIYE